MVRAAWEGAHGADLIVFVVDAKAGFKADANAILSALEHRSEPKLLVLNKVDIADKGRLLDLAAHANAIGELQRHVSSLLPRAVMAFPSLKVGARFGDAGSGVGIPGRSAGRCERRAC